MYFFTADEHFGHTKIIEYCNRPFKTLTEMDNTIMERFNSVVGKNDTTIHAGDFCWFNRPAAAQEYINQLNGNHIFIKGSHDHWMPDSTKYMWRKMIDGQFIMVCHYAMRIWERSHYNSWQLFGHSHGRLEAVGKQYDIGVDNNNFYPISFDTLKEIMSSKPDNFNFVGKKREGE